MSSLFIVIPATLLFALAYSFFGRLLERVWEVDPKKATPAYSKFDSVDYVPAKNWLILFGHHFSSIAGAGPIIGPTIAVMLWGWGPALAWILLGSIFIGGVHDFGSLMSSVREGGSSIADIAEDAISRKAKIIFSIFVWLALVLVIAVFAYLCADIFVKKPAVVLPSTGIIPVAMLVGWMLYNLRAGIVTATAIGLVCLAGLLVAGNYFSFNLSLHSWLALLLVYCFFASVLPVNILLQPRDYLSSFLLFFGVGCGYIGLFIRRPDISMPAYHHWSSQEGYLWPMLFVTIACGAVSGFHSLVSSGTTSKQLANQRYAKRIGFGAMMVEGIVALLAVIACVIMFRPGEDFAGILKRLSPIGVFGAGYGEITQDVLFGHGSFIAITILNAFILTTLDTATRISRYLSEELFGLKNRFLSTFLVVAASGLLAFSGKWQQIWPAFGASNQLVASLTLFVLSCWLMSRKKGSLFVLIPAFFMLFTTIAALGLQAKSYILGRHPVLSTICAVLIILACVMVWEVACAYRRRLSKCQKA